MSGRKNLILWQEKPEAICAYCRRPILKDDKSIKMFGFVLHDYCGEEFMQVHKWVSDSIKPVKPLSSEESAKLIGQFIILKGE